MTGKGQGENLSDGYSPGPKVSQAQGGAVNNRLKRMGSSFGRGHGGVRSGNEDFIGVVSQSVPRRALQRERQ